MSYIYDIVLNFHSNYYEYYEWNTNDKIKNISKIPIYKIDIKDYMNIKNYKTTINIETLPKKNKMFLMTTGIEVMGILLDKKGNVIKKSSLIYEEADDIINNNNLKIINIKYKITKKLENLCRINKDRNTFIYKSLKKIKKEKNEYLYKYIYYEIYNKDEKNLKKIYNDLCNLYKDNNDILYYTLIKVFNELKINI